MDPDGLSTTTTIIAFLPLVSAALALAAAFRAGAVSAAEPERQREGVLGFSDRMAGLCAAFVLACGLFIYGLLCLFALSLLWLLPLLAALLALAVVAFSFGKVTGRVKPAEGFTLSGLLGAPLAAPAKLMFGAMGLSAQPDVTEEDVLSYVDDVEERELIDESQKKMIANIFELDDVTAGDVMTHRTEITGVEENTPAVEAMRIATGHGRSRLPVYRKSLDEVVGILYIKDLFVLWDAPARANAPVREFMRGAMFVPEACRARELLVDFKRKRTQIAVVVDEYGGTSGLATMEDVLEEIVGNIQDEFDDEDGDLVPEGDGFLAEGSADLERIFEAFGMEPPDEDEDGEADFDSVGGLIIDRLGRLPGADEFVAVSYGGLLFTVVKAEERRVGKVKCIRDPNAGNGDGAKSEEEA